MKQKTLSRIVHLTFVLGLMSSWLSVMSYASTNSSQTLNTTAEMQQDPAYSPIDLAIRSFGSVPVGLNSPSSLMNQTRAAYRTSRDFSVGAMVPTTMSTTYSKLKLDNPALVAVQNYSSSDQPFRLSLEAQLYFSLDSGLPSSILLPQTILYKTKRWVIYSYSFLQYSWADRHANIHLFPAAGYEITPWFYLGGFVQATLGYLNQNPLYGNTFYGDFRAGPGMLVFLSPQISVAPLFGMNLLQPNFQNASFNLLVNAQIL